VGKRTISQTLKEKSLKRGRLTISFWTTSAERLGGKKKEGGEERIEFYKKKGVYF